MPNIFQPSLSNTPTYKSTTGTEAITPYATDLLQRGQAFATAETPVYEGQLTTGPSEYQNQAWQGLANLTVPTNITEAGNQLGNIASQQQNLSYTPGTITNTYVPAGGNYKPINVTNQYTAAGGSYKPIDVTTGTFGNEEAQKYMNPYIQQALDPQLEYMRRQAAINQQGDMAKLAQAGAFGGSRQAILQGQNQEALMRQQAATTGAGYQQAFSQAQQQFNADQARQMEATKANIQQAQTAAQMGMTDAQMMAQYGMTAQQANESSRQFSQNLKMTDAQMMAQYGMQATQANIQQAQKAADLGMSDAQLTAQYGMDAQKANELSRQFASTYKSNALQSAAQSQQARAGVGANEAQYGLSNLQALSAAGAQQQAQEQAALDAQYKEFLRQTEYPAQQLKQQQGIISAMAPVLPEKRTVYGQKESTAQTAAGLFGAAAAAMGIKTFDDLVKKAGEYGMTVENFKKIFGIGGPDTSDPASTGQTGLPGGYTPDEEGRSPPPPGYHRDPDGSLQPDVEPDYTIPDYNTPDEDYSYAKGGLMDLVHKMRSYK